eukprot:CAMPEP_0183302136 /NCGR_PEP_ID=MMETSP0160_2-20130417/8028_1 /TAXON_ID=2839 ORGANISM="Odontella Sinensis, Strain Grunow 1884" /NCGR_SAMPLE_ID=MMETSP0160_2 /ASSEMBLY_ACC=CAM_ASM_000250 /LENGTH=179 /DNA_ID=CAMNT_0025464867 /DNA_START=193 /DNA_END=729 /DNA_ORIENTATION=-
MTALRSLLLPSAAALLFCSAPLEVEAGGRPLGPGRTPPNVVLALSGGGDDGAAPNPLGSSMEEMMKAAGVDADKLDELMKSMPGGEGDMPSVEESMNAMQEMVNSPMFQQYMNDPEQLEKSRQMILENPMMKSMMGSMPGMEDILNDPEKWRETMQAAGEMYKNMGSNLMETMQAAGEM